MANDDKLKQPRSAAILLSLTLLDTSWRMFIPTIGGVIIGIALDHILLTTPVFTFMSVIVGSITSLMLIMSQLKGLKK